MFWCSEKTEHEWIAARLTASGFVVKTPEAACRPSCTHTLEVAPTHCQTCVCVCLSKRHKIWSLRCFNTHAWLLSLSTCNSNRVIITLLLLCYATHKKWPEKYRLQHLGHLVSFFFFCFFFFCVQSRTVERRCSLKHVYSLLLFLIIDFLLILQSETRMFNGVDKECPSPTEKLARKESLKVLLLSVQSRDYAKCLALSALIAVLAIKPLLSSQLCC